VSELVPSPSQTSGPLWGFALIFEGSENALDPMDPRAIRLRGRVTDGDGSPVAWPDALVEVWNGDIWARGRTDEQGFYSVVIAKPEGATTPDGRRLAPHLNLTLFARGLLRQIATRVYFPDEAEANAVDAVLEQVPEADRHTLVAREQDGELRFDVVLQGEGETVFFDF
jgi:protocatechuate 3,4-dioxygenase, alpha subunit